MQSVFKLPLAIDVFARRRRRDPPRRHAACSTDRYSSGPAAFLAEEIPATGGERTVLDLVERALITSDNTATDVLLERIGGPRKVTERLVGLGIMGIDVSRSEADLMMDFMGVTAKPPRDTLTLARLQEACRVPDAVRTRALATYLADPRDTATPTSTAELLLRVHRQDLLRKASAARLVGILERVDRQGPPESALARGDDRGPQDRRVRRDGRRRRGDERRRHHHPPGSAGHVIVAAFLKEARGDDAARAHALALVGRAVFDHYARR